MNGGWPGPVPVREGDWKAAEAFVESCIRRRVTRRKAHLWQVDGAWFVIVGVEFRAQVDVPAGATPRQARDAAAQILTSALYTLSADGWRADDRGWHTILT